MKLATTLRRHFRTNLVFLAPLLLLGLTACQRAGEAPAEEVPEPATSELADPVAAEQTAEDPVLRTRAEELAREMMIIDTHVDVPYRLGSQLEDEGRMDDISERTDGGDFDYPRAKAGGLDAPFMSIYVPATLQEEGGAKELADELITMVSGFAEKWPEKFTVATSPAEVEAAFAEGKIALPMGMENGAPIEGDLENLRHFYERGVRYITLTHSKANHICDSSYDEERKWNGLSPFGEEVVREMNRLGMMIDISHVTDETFGDVVEITQAPVIASHSSARHFTPGWERNMSDEMIVRLAENGGVIQINFGSAFLSADVLEQGKNRREAIRVFMEDNGIEDRGDPRVEAFADEHNAQHPAIFADVTDVVAHIDHVVDLVGIDHVGIGSDFDGVGDSLPTGLKDASQLPNLIFELLQAGYSEEDVAKILHGNILRVWRRVAEVAEKLQAAA